MPKSKALAPLPPNLVAKLPPRDQKMLKKMKKGQHPREIAKDMAPTNKKRQKRLIRHMYILAELDGDYQEIQARMAKGAQVTDIVDIVEAVNRKARTGRVDAAKLTFESSGFHNPKMQHEHSGEVKITVASVPRPERAIDVTSEEVKDAEVIGD